MVLIVQCAIVAAKDKIGRSRKSVLDQVELKSTKHLSFNDRGRRGCHKFVPVLGGDSTKIDPPRELFDQPPREMS